MSELIYCQVPCGVFKAGKWCCPVCFFEIEQCRTKKFNIYAKKHKSVALFEYELPYCGLCDIPVVHGNLIRHMRKSSDGFKVDYASSALIDEKPLVRMQGQDEGTKVSINRGIGYEMTEITPKNGISQKVFFVHSQTYDKLQSCMRCASVVRVSVLCGDDNTTNTIVKWCSCCNSFFLLDIKENRDIIQKILSQLLTEQDALSQTTLPGIDKGKRNTQSSAKEIEMQQHITGTEQDIKEKIVTNQEKIQNLPSAVVLVVAISSQGSSKTFTIVEKKKFAFEKSHRYHYTTEQAREILAAVFIQHKRKTFVLDGVVYRISEIVFPKEKQNVLPERLMPRQWRIKKDGGFASSIRGTNNSIVDILVYSPFSERYEIVKATYSVADDYCYTDVRIYRSFVKNLGNPELKLSLLNASMDGEGMFGTLNETSLLKEYGYDVSRKTNLTEKERQELLVEIVDLDIMKVHEIINYIDFFIDSHPQKTHEIARSKWLADKRYIASYKANPERFLIAKNNNPKR